MLVGLLAGGALGLGRVPARVSGPWYYIADGLETSHPFDPVPAWLDDAGNLVSLAFLNPADLVTKQDPVPDSFKQAAKHFNSKNKSVFFSIGGWAYQDKWTWLKDTSAATQAGLKCAELALTYNVSIEVDYEGGDEPTQGVVAFIRAFRSKCKMGQCLLSMDLFGSPGGAPWQRDTLPHVIPPTGVPGQTYGDGNWLDFVNVMVIDGQTVDIAQGYWQQWVDSKLLPLQRSTFGVIGGWPGLGICEGDDRARGQVDAASSWTLAHSTYGVLSWAVCPPAPGQTTTCGDWNPGCNANAPGFQYLCRKIGSCL